MMKKSNSEYESPLIQMLQLNGNDVIITSGDNYFQWGWDEEKPYDDGIFN